MNLLLSPVLANIYLIGGVATDLIRREAGNLLEKADVFLCGPPAMMDKVLESLKQLVVLP